MEHPIHSPAPALARGLRLLEQLAAEGHCSLEQLASRNGWPKSSILRCLQTLEHAGAVRQDGLSLRWHALQTLTPLGAEGLLRGMGVRLAELAAASGHTCELYEFGPDSLRLVDRADPENALVLVVARIGFERDLTEWDATATLFHSLRPNLPSREQAWVWRLGRKSPLSPDEQTQRLEAARLQDFSMDEDFNSNGIRRAARLLRENGTPRGIVAIAQRQTPRADEELPNLLSLLRNLSPAPTPP